MAAWTLYVRDRDEKIKSAIIEEAKKLGCSASVFIFEVMEIYLKEHANDGIRDTETVRSS